MVRSNYLLLGSGQIAKKKKKDSRLNIFNFNFARLTPLIRHDFCDWRSRKTLPGNRQIWRLLRIKTVFNLWPLVRYIVAVISRQRERVSPFISLRVSDIPRRLTVNGSKSVHRYQSLGERQDLALQPARSLPRTFRMTERNFKCTNKCVMTRTPNTRKRRAKRRARKFARVKRFPRVCITSSASPSSLQRN